MRLNTMTAEDLADLEPAHVCGTCRHFHAAELSCEDAYRDVGVCECFADFYGLSDAVILATDKPGDKNPTTEDCWEM